jgi:hypothetical protein
MIIKTLITCAFAMALTFATDASLDIDYTTPNSKHHHDSLSIQKKQSNDSDTVNVNSRNQNRFIPLVAINPLLWLISPFQYVQGNFAEKAWFPKDFAEQNEATQKTVNIYKYMGLTGGIVGGALSSAFFTSLASNKPSNTIIGGTVGAIVCGIGGYVGGIITGHISAILYSWIGEPLMKQLTGYQYPQNA